MSRDLESVYAENATFVWRVLRGMGVSDSQVEDAVQDVFVVVHRRYATFDHRCKVQTWLFEIAYRIACNYRRKSARLRQQVPLHDEDVYTNASSPAAQIENDESASLLARVLDDLDDNKRAVLVLADIEELTAPEIAELIRVPLNTVYTRLRRARIEFSEALARHKRRQR